MARILAAGVAVADFVFMVDEMPRSAEKYRTNEAYISGGGNAANAAVAICRLGGEAMLAARIGADLVGDMITAELSSYGVDVSLVDRAAEGKTSFSSIYVDRNGERQIMNFRGSGLGAGDHWPQEPERIDAVLADNRWPPLTSHALARARELGVPGIVDVEAPVEAECLDGATHLAFSRQGLASFAPGLGTTDALGKAHAISGGWACVTDGADGVTWFDGNRSGHIPAVRVEVVDTLGAGDVWHAAFALRLAEGAGEEAAVRFANATGAAKCMGAGGRASYPGRKEVDALAKSAFEGMDT